MLFGPTTKELVRDVLVEIKLVKENIMAEIEALRQAIVEELAQLRRTLNEEADQLRIEVLEAVELAQSNEEARREAEIALEEYRSRVGQLTNEVAAAGIFGSAENETPSEPVEENPTVEPEEPSEEEPVEPELPSTPEEGEEESTETGTEPNRGESGYFFGR